MDQIRLFAKVDPNRYCSGCQAQLPQRGCPTGMCLSCSNSVRGHVHHLLDLIELDQHYNPGEPIPMWGWATLCRATKSQDPDNVRRRWEDLKRWCLDQGAPVRCDLGEEIQAGRKPLFLERGIREWIRAKEAEWLFIGDEPPGAGDIPPARETLSADATRRALDNLWRISPGTEQDTG